MIPMRTKTVFKSRWWALLWSAGIVWFAVDVADRHAPPASNSSANASVMTDADGQPVDDADMQQIGDALNRM